MPTRRKTIHVAEIVSSANQFLALSKDEQVGERQGIIALVESVLHRTNTYAGFSYDAPSEVVRNGGDYDETRRSYYAPKV